MIIFIVMKLSQKFGAHARAIVLVGTMLAEVSSIMLAEVSSILQSNHSFNCKFATPSPQGFKLGKECDVVLHNSATING